jgi:hypothetical protein
MVVATPLTDLPVMGEADIKFTRYADMYGSLMVDSIDGDSIPIALLHHETRLRETGFAPRVFIYRMALKDRSCGPATSKKRDATAAPKDGEKPKQPPKLYEYVDIFALHAGLKDVIFQSVGRIILPRLVGHEITMLVSLMALTGTDFSRNLPLLTGRSVYGFLPHIWVTLGMVFDPDTGLLRVDEVADRLVALLYSLKFSKHSGADRRGYTTVISRIKASKLKPITLDYLPSLQRVQSTVCNVNWVMLYWRCISPIPDPMDPSFGYGWRGKNRLPCFLDEASREVDT